MGGNAIKKVKTSRLDLETYNKVKEDIKSRLEKYALVSYIHDLPEKTSFGDIDLIYICEEKIVPILQKEFSPVEIVSNGDVTSFAYQMGDVFFQVDLIKCPRIESLPMYQFYFSWGDCGPILGRVLKYYGFKYGHKGLFVNIVQNESKSIDQTFENIEIKLSSEPKRICDFIGLDYERWCKGFETQLEIMEYLSSFKFFKASIFTKLNSDHRKRLVKRPFYMKFISYIGINIQKINTIENSNHLGEIGENYQKEAIIYFDKKDELDKCIEKVLLRKTRNEKFNGNKMIKKLTQIYGEQFDKKLINNHMINFKEYLSKYSGLSNYDESVDKYNESEIDEILDAYLLRKIY